LPTFYVFCPKIDLLTIRLSEIPMNPYQQKKRWKYSLLTFAVVIASGSLLYTSYLVRNIAKSERTRAQVWAMSMKQVLASDDNDFLSYVFAIRDSSIVPAIVTDNKGEIQLSRGLDSTKTFIKLEAEDKTKGKPQKKYDIRYFKSELAAMKEQHTPIKLKVLDTEWLVYYKDSDLLTELKYFPYIQLSVIAIFLLLAYTAFRAGPGLGGPCQRNCPPTGYAHLVVDGLDRAHERKIQR